MDIWITEWALQSYLDLKVSGVFTATEYKNVLRPDVERLKRFPNDPKFKNPRFWGPATDKSGSVIAGAYKMKWRNIGPGNVQLRLGVLLSSGAWYLCQAYVKQSRQADQREMANLKRRLNLLVRGAVALRGKL